MNAREQNGVRAPAPGEPWWLVGKKKNIGAAALVLELYMSLAPIGARLKNRLDQALYEAGL